MPIKGSERNDSSIEIMEEIRMIHSNSNALRFRKQKQERDIFIFYLSGFSPIVIQSVLSLRAVRVKFSSRVFSIEIVSSICIVSLLQPRLVSVLLSPREKQQVISKDKENDSYLFFCLFFFCSLKIRIAYFLIMRFLHLENNFNHPNIVLFSLFVI